MEEDRSKVFSPSKLDTYKNCPRQYKYRYIDRIRSEEHSVEAFMGSCVHSAFEAVYEARSHAKVMTEDEAAAVYATAWDDGFSDKVVFRDKRYTIDDWKKTGEECVRLYCRAHTPFDQDRTVGVEKRVSFSLDLPDAESRAFDTVKIEGYVDRIALAPDGAFEIHDYKTSQSLPTQEQKDKDWQLAIYEIAVRQNWPDAKSVRLIWHFVRHGKSITSVRSPEQLLQLKHDLADLIRAIKRDHEFEPKKSPLCDWCDYRALCPLFKHVDAYQKLPPDERPHESGVKLAEEWAKLENKKKALRSEVAMVESEQDDLAKKLFAYADQHDARTLACSEGEVEIHSRTDYRFPTKTHAPEKLEQIETELRASPVWSLISKLDPKPLMEGFESHRWPPGVMAKVEGWLGKWIRKETTRTLRLKRRKEEE